MVVHMQTHSLLPRRHAIYSHDRQFLVFKKLTGQDGEQKHKSKAANAKKETANGRRGGRVKEREERGQGRNPTWWRGKGICKCASGLIIGAGVAAATVPSGEAAGSVGGPALMQQTLGRGKRMGAW